MKCAILKTLINKTTILGFLWFSFISFMFITSLFFCMSKEHHYKYYGDIIKFEKVTPEWEHYTCVNIENNDTLFYENYPDIVYGTVSDKFYVEDNKLYTYNIFTSPYLHLCIIFIFALLIKLITL